MLKQSVPRSKKTQELNASASANNQKNPSSGYGSEFKKSFDIERFKKKEKN